MSQVPWNPQCESCRQRQHEENLRSINILLAGIFGSGLVALVSSFTVLALVAMDRG